jgi:5-methyltetrahydrofolate--homocysteine methyltransferase
MMADIALRFQKDMVVLDGAMATLLIAEDIDPEMPGILLNVMEPELITEIHKRYLAAGAQALTTNSFTGNRPMLASDGLEDQLVELNRLAVRLAKACKPEHVLADVGPCGLLPDPADACSLTEIIDIYAEQIEVLASEQPDAILIESMVSIHDACAALQAAKSVTDLPVFVSISFDAENKMPFTGTDPAAAASILEAAGADVIGVNCGSGTSGLDEILSQMAEASNLPLLVQPRIGPPPATGSPASKSPDLVLPDPASTSSSARPPKQHPRSEPQGSRRFIETPDDMAEAAWLYRQLGAQFIGSCCGSRPSFTAAIYGTVGSLDVVTAGRPEYTGSPKQIQSGQETKL